MALLVCIFIRSSGVILEDRGLQNVHFMTFCHLACRDKGVYYLADDANSAKLVRRTLAVPVISGAATSRWHVNIAKTGGFVEAVRHEIDVFEIWDLSLAVHQCVDFG